MTSPAGGRGTYLALGANLGDREGNIALALRLLEPDIHVEAVSPLYESEPQGGPAQPVYLNAACRVTTMLPPRELLRRVKAIEKQLGRRPALRWSPRPIDIDIILYDDLVMSDGELTIPHPRMLQRAFVLRPLIDLNPDLAHPVTGEGLSAALDRIGEQGLARWRSADDNEGG